LKNVDEDPRFPQKTQDAGKGHNELLRKGNSFRDCETTNHRKISTAADLADLLESVLKGALSVEIERFVF